MKTNKSSVRRSLIVSATALVLTVAMLIGTTFAWFTDSVSSGINTIKSGNLDMVIQYSTDLNTWKNVDSTTPVFTNADLVEPGYTQIVYLKVKNNGSLAFKYNLGVDINSGMSGSGLNVYGKRYYIWDYLQVGIANVTTPLTRAEAWNAVADTATTLGKGITFNSDPNSMPVLEAGKTSDPIAMVIYMPTSVGNEANPKNKSKNSKVAFNLTASATQATVEEDSFGIDYDENAATILHRIEYTTGDHEVTGNIQADGGHGAIHITGGTTTVNASTVYAVESYDHFATAVKASNASKVVINSGEFAQQITGTSDHYDLIYAEDSAQIEINGGTFKATTPKWTLNCADGSSAKITVKGGSFYKFNPATDNLNEVVVPSGYHVEQSGDWYTVVRD